MVDDEIETDFEELQKLKLKTEKSEGKIVIQSRITKEEYLEKVGGMLEHIHRGDIYEANLCQEFFSENVDLDAFSIYQSLNEISTPPFAAFLRLENINLVSASPERYLRKKVINCLLSQLKELREDLLILRRIRK